MKVVSECPKCGKDVDWISPARLFSAYREGRRYLEGRPSVCPHCAKKLTARSWHRHLRAAHCARLAKQADMPLDEWRQMRRREAEWAVSRFNPFRKPHYHPCGGPRG